MPTINPGDFVSFNNNPGWFGYASKPMTGNVTHGKHLRGKQIVNVRISQSPRPNDVGYLQTLLVTDVTVVRAATPEQSARVLVSGI